jgi:hypothetical protein
MISQTRVRLGVLTGKPQLGMREEMMDFLGKNGGDKPTNMA